MTVLITPTGYFLVVVWRFVGSLSGGDWKMTTCYSKMNLMEFFSSRRQQSVNNNEEIEEVCESNVWNYGYESTRGLKVIVIVVLFVLYFLNELIVNENVELWSLCFQVFSLCFVRLLVCWCCNKKREKMCYNVVVVL